MGIVLGNMPHVRPTEYIKPDDDYTLEYVEIIQRHHKRTPYQSNTYPREDVEWDCGGLEEYAYARPVGRDEMAVEVHVCFSSWDW